MLIWQADCYRRPLQDSTRQPLWELLICDPEDSFEFAAFCPQSAVKLDWLVQQFQAAIAAQGQRPERIEVFRPPALNLIAAAGKILEIPIYPNRHTDFLKQLLRERVQIYQQREGYTGEPYDPLALDRPPPVPLPEKSLGRSLAVCPFTGGSID
ncbi:MAG: DUF1092 family protein [Oscillatoriales cyanobacterium SM2_3_0]|nr:DUF1092 family protein [Oscillatoriales cyanobacterium SM2_3_0]